MYDKTKTPITSKPKTSTPRPGGKGAKPKSGMMPPRKPTGKGVKKTYKK